MSYTLVLFFLLSIAGLPISTCFAIAGVFEMIMTAVIVRPLFKNQDIPTNSFYGALVAQYSDGDFIDPLEMLHITGARVLAALLGYYAVFFYIPAAIVYITTISDIKKARK